MESFYTTHRAFIRGLQIVFVSFQVLNLAHPQSQMASSFLSSSKIEEVVRCVCVPLSLDITLQQSLEIVY